MYGLSVMDGLDAEDYDRNYSDRDLVRRIVGYFRPQAAQDAGVAAAMIVLAAAARYRRLPIFISRGIDPLQRRQHAPAGSP